MAKTTCSVPGCGKPTHARGYCGPHHQRLLRTGDVQANEPLRTMNPGALCSIEGCKHRVAAHGWCQSHYSRVIKHGTVDAETPLYRKAASAAEAFLRQVDMSSGPDACWPWHNVDRHGYGRVTFGTYRLAHRVAYETLVGPIPEGLTIDHLCRNTRCVNPGHMEPVTTSENIRRGLLARGGKRRRG